MNQNKHMETKFECWQLTEFNLEGQINLNQKFGLIKIYRSDDGILVLVGDVDYGVIDQESPTPASFLKPDSLLGFVLDIGVQREKLLTYDSGFYFGKNIKSGQSIKRISQQNFDENLFGKIGSVIDDYYRSGDKKKETEAIKVQLLFDAYNNARLLFPDFYADSYLGLMRILDALSAARGRYDFASFAADISSDFNKNVYQKLDSVYKDRLKIAEDLFSECLQEAASNGWGCHNKMKDFDDPAKIIFVCFYSAYQYRSQFVHAGFPFPDTVKYAVGLEEGSGTAYLNPALGMSWFKMHRPDGLQEGDLIDIHEVVDREEAQNFRDKYFRLLPTWYFLKSLTREALLKKISSMP